MSIEVVFLAALITVLAGTFVGAQPSRYRIGVLTPGGDFGPVLEGLRQGLAQLGYEEGKQISFRLAFTPKNWSRKERSFPTGRIPD